MAASAASAIVVCASGTRGRRTERKLHGQPLIDDAGAPNEYIFQYIGVTGEGENVYKSRRWSVEGKMVLLHGFVTKTQKAPKADLDLLALKRKKEVRS